MTKPSEADLLDGPRMRLKHAQGHLKTLKDGLTTYMDAQPHRLVGKQEPETCDLVWRIVLGEQPPMALRLIAGDCIHNLRASLDNLAWNLACAHKEPAPERTEFPVCSSSDAFKNSAWKIEGVLPDAKPIIEDLQPYKRVPDAPKADILWGLNRLWNDDKHRVPTLFVGLLARGELEIEEAILSGPPQIHTGPVDQDMEVVRLPRPLRKPDLKGKFTLSVVFDKDGPGMGEEVVGGLWKCHDFIEEMIFPRFADLVG